MENYETILKEFIEIGYQGNEQLQKPTLMNSLNLLAIKNSAYQLYDREIALQLWDHSKPVAGKVHLSYFIKSVCEAQSRILEKMYHNNFELNSQTNLNRQKHMAIKLYYYAKHYQMLTHPFKIIEKQSHVHLRKSLPLIPDTLNDSRILSFELNNDTTGLKIVFWLGLMMLGLQMLMMFHKHHFYGLLCCCLVLSIFWLNFFDALFVKIVLGNLAVSSMFDIVWVIVRAKIFWKNDMFTIHHSTIQNTFLRFIVVITLLIIVSKFMLFALLFKYRSIDGHFTRKIVFFKLQFQLDANPQHNPVTACFKAI